MFREFGVGANVGKPQVAYRETIRKKAEAEGKFIRQTGGRGQYGHVKIIVEPNEPGKGFEFVNKIVGGSVPKEFIAPVEKGITEALETGVLAGFEVQDVKVTLYDGSYHDVDSSEMAFKLAASGGFKSAVDKARPVLLEPILSVEVAVPDDVMGDVIGDVNSRRGKVQGVEPRGHAQVIKAQVPMAEMLKYAPDLNAMSAGRGSFHAEFSHYEELPAHLVDKVAKESKRHAEEG
jgi:elongation factor G